MLTKPPRNKVLLVAEDEMGKVIERLIVSVDQYYDGSVPIVDDSPYRKQGGIRRLRGEIYGLKKNVTQRFIVQYDQSGEYQGFRAVHEDGKVIQRGDIVSIGEAGWRELLPEFD